MRKKKELSPLEPGYYTARLVECRVVEKGGKVFLSQRFKVLGRYTTRLNILRPVNPRHTFILLRHLSVLGINPNSLIAGFIRRMNRKLTVYLTDLEWRGKIQRMFVYNVIRLGGRK